MDGVHRQPKGGGNDRGTRRLPAMSRVWKVSWFGHVGASVVLAIATVCAFLIAGPATGLVVLALGGALAWLFVYRPAVILTGTEVIIRNPWGTRRVPLGDVAGTGGAYAGLSVRRRSGGAVNAWAVQKSNAATWSGRTSRADEAAAAIMTAASHAPVQHTP